MKDEVSCEQLCEQTSQPENLNKMWQRVVRRRSFLKNLGIASAALPIAAVSSDLLTPLARAGSTSRSGKLPPGDVAILRLLAAAELIESDLWSQYAELGGAHGKNPAYIAGLQNLDGDMPQYVEDNTDDELSHAAFINAYLLSKGEKPVDLSGFRRNLASQATGASQIPRLTNLKSLDVDTSWYTRFRSEENPDLGTRFTSPLLIQNQPAIPLNDQDTPPNLSIPQSGSSFNPQQARLQAIANTAGFHFAFIEQGGSSLYPTMALSVTNVEVLRIVLSIGGVEIDHFGLWHDKAGNAISQPLAGITDPETGLTFPDFNSLTPLELTQTNKILPEPCDFLRDDNEDTEEHPLPACSVIRPISKKNSGAVAAINSFITDNLFLGQSDAFVDFVLDLAARADAAERGF